VTEDGLPLESAWVCVYTPAEVAIGCTGADENGRYSYEGLPVGSYVLEVERFGQTLLFSGGAKTFADATQVTVDPEGAAIEDFELHGPPGISGTVLDASTGEAPTTPVSACVASDRGSICWQINWDGTYQIPELEPGTYLVWFEGLNYVEQYYDGVSDEKDATLVTIGDSMLTEIDAELQPAGTLTGHMTVAGTGANLSAEACAFDQSGAEVACGNSGSSTGIYKIPSLPPDQYKVKFRKSGYTAQYYNGKATLAEADPVTVTGGATTSGIDAAMAVPPKNTAKPQLSGEAKVGTVLGCSQGTWSGSPTLYEYFWLRGSERILGEEGSTYTVAPADAGKTLRCGVTAEVHLGGRVSAESQGSLKIPAARQLSVSTAGSGTGTVTSSPAGIDCGQSCTLDAYQGDQVTLTATPATHSEFTGWSGANCPGTGTCLVTLGSTNASITATFAMITHPLTVTVTGAGSVSGDSGAIAACAEASGTCTDTYDEGAEVTLTATPEAHQQLAGWTGCTTETDGACEVTVEGAEDVTATFVPIVRQLSIAKSGEGSGAVTGSPAGIECGATCAVGFEEGTAVTLTAVAASGSEFTGWSGGGCSGTGTCLVTLDQDASVVAGFAPKPSDDGGGSDAGDDQQSASNPPSSSPLTTSPSPPKHVTKKKPLRCKKGFHKVKRKGKARCVKTKTKAKGGKKAKPKGKQG